MPKTTRLQRLSESEAIEQGLDFYFDQSRADHVTEFFESLLIHSKGRFAGKNFELLGWQRYMLEELFGWARVDNHTRRYRMAYISTAKKSGKSTTLAGIGLYLLVGDGEPGAEIYGAATDREQASLVFREAANMVKASPLFVSSCWRLWTHDARLPTAKKFVVSTESFQVTVYRSGKA